MKSNKIPIKPLENIILADFEKNLKRNIVQNIVNSRDLKNSIEEFRFELGGYIDTGKKYQ
jgi:hypothetical protein